MEMKVKCVGYKDNERYFTEGKIYTWKDNTLKCDNGFDHRSMVDGTDIANWQLSKWYEFEEVPDNFFTITIHSDGFKETTAIMTDNKGTEVGRGTSRCHPDDKFNAQLGAGLAMEYMFNLIEEQKKPVVNVGDTVYAFKIPYSDDIDINTPFIVVNTDDGEVFGIPMDSEFPMRMKKYFTKGLIPYDTALPLKGKVDKIDYKRSYSDNKVENHIDADNNFKVGDRVKALINVGNKNHTVGRLGTIISLGNDDCLVQFDKNINGHSGNGRGKNNHCWWMTYTQIKKI